MEPLPFESGMCLCSFASLSFHLCNVRVRVDSQLRDTSSHWQGTVDAYGVVMKPRREELWCVDVWIAIGRLFTERGPNGGQQWQGKVMLEFPSGHVVTANWIGDEGDTTGKLVDFVCSDEVTCEQAERREEEFSRAIVAALHVEDSSAHTIATQADVEKEADRVWAA